MNNLLGIVGLIVLLIYGTVGVLVGISWPFWFWFLGN